MKNGYSSIAPGGTEFWNSNYRPYIRTINFGNDLSNLPSSCTEENLCWDISYDTSQNKKVYGYLVDTGLKDSTDNTKPLYNLYIVSEAQIFAPSYCKNLFTFYKYENSKYISNLISINFNNNFNTSNVTNMECMFQGLSLTSLNLSSFNTANVTNMTGMFYNCKSLINLDLSSFNTSNVTNMYNMFIGCSSLTSLDLSNFNTTNVTNMNDMFRMCKQLKSLDLSSFNTSNVIEMEYMFYFCPYLTTTIKIMSANVSKYSNMFHNAATNSGSQITVNYIADASALVDNMIATKSKKSNVVKGTQI